MWGGGGGGWGARRVRVDREWGAGGSEVDDDRGMTGG